MLRRVLQVVEALIQAKWTTFGFQFKLLLLCEHMAYLLLTVAYLVLITQWDGLCAEGDAADAVAPPDGAEAFVSCDTGIASLALLVCMLVVCAFQSTVYIRQLHSLGVGMWFASPSNWGSLLTVALQVMVAIGHLQRCAPGEVLLAGLGAPHHALRAARGPVGQC